ncbi:T6SS immunity protein Tli3 family protein, partial [Caballeronia terrestris]|uniref:T6SS immunity protein Tli3 family protein n=1 Tax=Caballeronia terrestris TaxID=1226301 RepID=UPI000B0967FF
MNVVKLALILSVAACTACVSDAERSRYSGPRPVPHYDVPAQVIYRIDDHRYIVGLAESREAKRSVRIGADKQLRNS